MLGIIGAMDEEVSKLKECMKEVTVTKKAGMEFFKGTLSSKEVVVVRSGIGKVNAAVCAQILVDDFKVSALINTGIAGSLKNEINIGDVVLSSDVLYHDMDAVAFGYNLGQVPRMDVLSFTADKDLVELAEKSCHKVNPEIAVFVGRIVSGDQFVSSKERKDWIFENFKGSCTEMEGAAIAHTAYLNQVPFVIIRAISDKADDSAHMDYPTFEALAIERSVKLMIEMVGRYNGKNS